MQDGVRNRDLSEDQGEELGPGCGMGSGTGVGVRNRGRAQEPGSGSALTCMMWVLLLKMLT